MCCLRCECGCWIAFHGDDVLFARVALYAYFVVHLICYLCMCVLQSGTHLLVVSLILVFWYLRLVILLLVFMAVLAESGLQSSWSFCLGGTQLVVNLVRWQHVILSTSVFFLLVFVIVCHCT